MADRDVTTLGPEHVDRAGATLGRAFADDPLFLWAVPDDPARDRHLPWLFRTVAAYTARYGEGFTTDGIDGAALWLVPGDTTVGALRMVRLGMLLVPWKFGIRATRKYVAATNELEHLHKRAMPDAHWYLMTLGVDPPSQGRGLGGALIQPVLQRADDDRLPCYLETTKERNLNFYRRHGFEVVLEGGLPLHGPPFWAMRRPGPA